MEWALKWRRWRSETLGIPRQLACPFGALLRWEELGNTMKIWVQPLVWKLVQNCSRRQGASPVDGPLARWTRAAGTCDICPVACLSRAGPWLGPWAAHLCRPQGRSHPQPLPGCRTHVTPEGGLRSHHPGLMCWYFRGSSRRRGGKGRRTTELSVLPFIVGH